MTLPALLVILSENMSLKKLSLKYNSLRDKNKKFEAALIYYRYVISEYPRTIWAHYARLGIGEVHFKKKEYEQAKNWFQLIINADVDAELKEKAEKKLDKIEDIESR